jgi:hypothetical protein
MKTQSEEPSSPALNKTRLTKGSLILFVLALLPFVSILFLRWLNTFGYYLHPLFMIGIFPLGAISLIAVFLAEINNIKKNYQGTNSGRMWLLCIALGFIGIVATIIFMWITYAYTLKTYMQR